MIELRSLSKRFGGLAAVDDVSMSIEPGKISAIIGPNGAGKTTLFNLISGFLAPTSGSVLLRGEDVTGVAPASLCGRGVVRTFQLVQLFKAQTALENVKIGAHSTTRGGFWSAVLRTPAMRGQEQALHERCMELLDFMGLAAHHDLASGLLPYGQQRLLEIARALAAKPQLLMLDEPAAGLNGTETAALSIALQKIRDSGVTVLVIEHDMNLIMNTADHIVALDFGRKIAEGTPALVREHPALIEAYLGRPREKRLRNA